MKSKFEQDYKAILINVINNGSYQPNRTNTNTFSLFGLTLTHNLNEGFPIVTGKAIFQKNFIHELIWFVNGETNIKYLNDNNVKIWDSWADENGELGNVYGYQMRNFCGIFDQLTELINNLKSDKYSRRHIITLWNPIDLHKMALPPCYFSFQFHVDNKDNLNLNVFMRSCDLFVGLPYDFAMFAALLHVIAKEVGLKANLLQFNITDAHIYENHLKNILLYLQNDTFDLPQFTFIGNINSLKYSDFAILNYKHGKFLKSEISI